LLILAEQGEGGRVALIGGEPGSGKTRLVRELAQEAADRGTLVLYGTSGANVNSPYRPFVELLDCRNLARGSK
jgi:MoxR-like ATPase